MEPEVRHGEAPVCAKFKFEAVRLINERGVGIRRRQKTVEFNRAHAQWREAVFGRSATCIPRPRLDETRAV
jgi:hypothetical protein